MEKNKYKKIQTIVKCPKCGTKIDMSNIKQGIKERLDLELDYILEKI